MTDGPPAVLDWTVIEVEPVPAPSEPLSAAYAAQLLGQTPRPDEGAGGLAYAHHRYRCTESLADT